MTKLVREEVEKNKDRLLASMNSLLDISGTTVGAGILRSSRQPTQRNQEIEISVALQFQEKGKRGSIQVQYGGHRYYGLGVGFSAARGNIKSARGN